MVNVLATTWTIARGLICLTMTGAGKMITIGSLASLCGQAMTTWANRHPTMNTGLRAAAILASATWQVFPKTATSSIVRIGIRRSTPYTCCHIGHGVKAG